MPNASKHRQKVESNRKFLVTISCEDFPEWAVVVAFYTAVHLVKWLRAANGDGDSTSHEDRLAHVQQVHPKIHTSYFQLQNASMLARYQSRPDFFNQFQPDQVKDLLVDRYLTQIEQYVSDRLGDPQPSTPAEG